MKKILVKLLNRLRGVQSIEKLKKRGLKIGNNVTIMGGVIIDPSHCWHISIGSNVILAPRVHILAHDASTKLFIGYTKVANVKIGNNVFIGASSTILPGVTIGNSVVIGAGSIVTKDIPNNTVAVGSPARVVCSLDSYIEKQKQKMSTYNIFDEAYTLRNNRFSEQHRVKMLTVLQQYKQIFVE